MRRRRRLKKRQVDVIEDLFNSDLDEQTVLAKHKLSRHVYDKWLGDELFRAEFARRVAHARFQSEALIAKYSLLAAAKLVQLTESAKEETARRACLDIISLPRGIVKVAEGPGKAKKECEKPGQELSEGTVSRLLATLAEERNGG